jgi:peptidoglycan hydrolase-like protein with peptidoglycan-binding domain
MEIRAGRRRLWLATNAAAAVLLVTFVAGCGGSSSNATDAPSSTSASTRATTTVATSSTTTTSSTTVPAPTTTATLPPSTTSTTAAPSSPAGPEVLRRGSEGPVVTVVQHRLLDLGFRPGGEDGHYGNATYAAVMAFQKHEGLQPDGNAGPLTLAALQAGLRGAEPRGGPTPRIEIDLGRQIAFVVGDDGTTRIVNVSSGSGKQYDRPQGGTAIARTPTGDYEIERRIDGVRTAPLGKLYRPLYFKGGFAIHGSSNVPGYPASHGCVRTTNPDQDYIWNALPNGTAVDIYES